MADGACGRVALGMSGGVDSAVSAAVLLRAGYAVVGVTCRFQDDAAARRAEDDAAAVCARLGIDHAVVDATGLFECEVVSPFVEAYARGLTPSPCIGCNARCKVPALLAAASDLGCGAVATGHYARIAQMAEGPGAGRFVVKRALDASKDQSYMLALLSQDQLARLVLPLGGMTKTDVRLMAADLGLPVADKPESQDLCFTDDYRALLAARGAADEPGPIVDGAGRVLGTHEGLSHYTVGQRKGIGVAGPAPYYVVAKRPEARELVVGFAEDALIGRVTVAAPVWQAFEELDAPLEASVKLRYRSRASACIIEPAENDRVRVLLRTPQPMTAPGQFAVFSLGDTVLGGGMIEEVGK